MYVFSCVCVCYVYCLSVNCVLATAAASVYLTDSVGLHAHVCVYIVIIVIIINQPGVASRSKFFPTVWNPLSVYIRTVHWHPKMFPLVVLWTLFRRKMYCWQTNRRWGSRQWKRPTANCTPTWLDRLRIPRHLSTLFPFGIGAVVTLI